MQELLLRNASFDVSFDSVTGGVNRLSSAGDAFDTNFVLTLGADNGTPEQEQCALGDILLTTKSRQKSRSVQMSTRKSRDIRNVSSSPDEISILYETDSGNEGGVTGLTIHERFTLVSDRQSELRWTFSVTNPSEDDVEIEDLGFPLPMNSYWGHDQTQNYEKRVHKHSFVAGHGSYVYWQRPCGEGPILLLTTSPGTSLEFKHRYREHETPFGEELPQWEGLSEYFIHSKHISQSRAEQAAAYLPATSRTLKHNETADYSFIFSWANDFADLRRAIYSSGGLDAVSLPGMVVPKDQPISLALRSTSGILDVIDPHDKKVRIEFKQDSGAYRIYRLHLSQIGENRVQVQLRDGQKSTIQYFCIDFIDSLIEKHAAFLVKNQLARSQRGYNGAFLQWDMSQQKLLTWDNYPGGGWKEWMAGGSDDLGLAPAAFLSERCLTTPIQTHVDALDYHIQHFLLGYLMAAKDDKGQRTFQVYRWFDGQDGTPKDTGIWRAYNYTHIANLFYNMFRIATAFPSISLRLEATEYLKYAFEVLHAMYSKIPLPNPIGDAAHTLGLMGESTMPEIATALAGSGMSAEAKTLEGYMMNKLEYYRTIKYPFASEQTIDTTGFESVYTLAKRFGAKELADKSQKASLASRGLQPLWYFYGSDNRMMGESYWNLGYETQLGAWQQQEYLAEYASQLDDGFSDSMRSTYGAYLAGWANINCGQIDHHSANIGAASWLWQSEGGRCAWPWMPLKGQWWAWSGEADLGFWGGLRTASVNVVIDPICGLYAYGGEVSLRNGQYDITPKDGVQRRLTLYPCKNFSIEVSHATIARALIDEQLSTVELQLTSHAPGGSNCTVVIKRGSSTGYQTTLDNQDIGHSHAVGSDGTSGTAIEFVLKGSQVFRARATS